MLMNNMPGTRSVKCLWIVVVRRTNSQASLGSVSSNLQVKRNLQAVVAIHKLSVHTIVHQAGSLEGSANASSIHARPRLNNAVSPISIYNYDSASIRSPHVLSTHSS